VFYPHGSKEKICPTYFEIGQTYFKIQGTYFLLSENPFENRGKNADKQGRRNLHLASVAFCSRSFGLWMTTRLGNARKPRHQPAKRNPCIAKNGLLRKKITSSYRKFNLRLKQY
jgi:hypothetical protein